MKKICPKLSGRPAPYDLDGDGVIKEHRKGVVFTYCLEEECGCWNKERKECGFIVRG